jgi:flagellar assembly protein FliH
MSSSPVIPKEKLSAYQRWELHSFDSVSDRHPDEIARAAAESADKIQHINQRAYQAGHADGLREGKIKSAADALAMQELLTGIRQRSAEFNQNLADELLGLALEVARKVTRHALTIRPQMIIPVVQDALAHVAEPAAQANIMLHPQDAALVREQLGEQLASGGWKIVEDTSIARGGCLLETSACKVDATLDTRWRQIVATLGQSTQWLD